MTIIKKCNCINNGQDKLHGNNMRVKNKTGKVQGDKPVYRCTVCLKESA